MRGRGRKRGEREQECERQNVARRNGKRTERVQQTRKRLYRAIRPQQRNAPNESEAGPGRDLGAAPLNNNLYQRTKRQ